MANFDDHEEEFDDEPSPRRSRSRSRSSVARQTTGRGRHLEATSGDMTGKALLIGGCVLALGIGGMIFVRMSKLNSTANDLADTSEVAVPQTTADVLDNEPETEIVIPEIAIPDDAPATRPSSPKRTPRRTVSETNVVSPDDETDESQIASGGSPAVSPSDDAIKTAIGQQPDFSRDNPFENVRLTNSVGREEGNQLLAAANSVFCHVNRLAGDERGTVSRAIENGVTTGLDRCRLPATKTPGVPAMLVELSVIRNKVQMTATMIGKDDSGYHSIWQKSAQIGAVSDQALREGILSTNFEREADAFFVDLRGILVELRRQRGN